MEEYQFHVSIELNATVTPPQSNLRVLLQVQLWPQHDNFAPKPCKTKRFLKQVQNIMLVISARAQMMDFKHVAKKGNQWHQNHQATCVLWAHVAWSLGKTSGTKSGPKGQAFARSNWSNQEFGIPASHILESCKLEDPLTSVPKIPSVHTAVAKLVGNMLHVCLSLQSGGDILHQDLWMRWSFTVVWRC